jgi:hypothetical protein
MTDRDGDPIEQPADDAWHRTYLELGYEWCRPCREYHRPPECAIDEQGLPELDWIERFT